MDRFVTSKKYWIQSSEECLQIQNGFSINLLDKYLIYNNPNNSGPLRIRFSPSVEGMNSLCLLDASASSQFEGANRLSSFWQLRKFDFLCKQRQIKYGGRLRFVNSKCRYLKKRWIIKHTFTMIVLANWNQAGNVCLK